MDQNRLHKSLADFHLGGIRYFDSLDSTNDEAMRWVEEGAPELGLVIAAEQTAGRGRQGRSWYTIPGASLAFSLVLYPKERGTFILPRLTALGALAVREALQTYYGIPAQIKWPNDVLLDRRKVAGVLAEAHWSGETLKALVLGIGINVSSASIRTVSSQGALLPFPSTYVEAILDRPVDPLELLHEILVELIRLRSRVGLPEFMQAWERSLAFRGEWVRIFQADGSFQEDLPSSIEEGMIVGLAPDGSLKLRDHAGEVVAIRFGEVRLRPVPVSSQA